MKVKTSKGFTLAELLIVMAIITVLAAIAIPTFGKQLETAREASDAESIRAALAEGFNEAFTAYMNAGTIDKDDPYPAAGAMIKITQTTPGFKFITPTYTVGSATVTVNTALTTNPASTDTKAWFYFDNDTDGIKLEDIQVGAAANSAVSIKAGS